MAAPIAWRLNWSAFWKSGCVGQLYTKQTKKTKNLVMHPPEAGPISDSQALARGSKLARRRLAPPTRGIGDNAQF